MVTLKGYYTEEQEAILSLDYLYFHGYVTKWQYKRIARKIMKYLSEGQINRLKGVMLKNGRSRQDV